MAELRVIQVRSANGADPSQRAALRSLGLGRIGPRPSDPTSPPYAALCASSST